MNAEDIQTIQDLIDFLGEKKVRRLFEEYLIEVVGKKNQDRNPEFEF